MSFSCFKAADIYLPDFNKVENSKWAVIACDQYTSEPEYWNEVEKNVGNSPSALRVTLPEVYLSETEERIPKINAEMERYLKEFLVCHKQSMIYLERTQANGKMRRGIIGMIDLEDYDYSKGASSLVRATEGTVLSRIPPRVKIRRDALLELPHVILLIDDEEKTVIEPIAESARNFETAYDFDLMHNAGHVIGKFIPEDEQKRIITALCALGTPDAMRKKYSGDFSPLIFAVGDGNHSLATAKTCYEELKANVGKDEAMKSPARYALVEIENLHDDTLVFEPIYRVVFGADTADLMLELKKYVSELKGTEKKQTITAVTAGGDEIISVDNPVSPLTVGTLQSFLDTYVEKHEGVEVDYIHGENSLRKLAVGENAIGFLFEGMRKDELFRTVICDGALPRKTFSMGHADDKRFYIESRKIK